MGVNTCMACAFLHIKIVTMGSTLNRKFKYKYLFWTAKSWLASLARRVVLQDMGVDTRLPVRIPVHPTVMLVRVSG